jgi:hypothetical protein
MLTYADVYGRMQTRFDKMKSNLEYCIELQKKEFKEHFEGQLKSAKVIQFTCFTGTKV